MDERAAPEVDHCSTGNPICAGRTTPAALAALEPTIVEKDPVIRNRNRSPARWRNYGRSVG